MLQNEGELRLIFLKFNLFLTLFLFHIFSPFFLEVYSARFVQFHALYCLKFPSTSFLFSNHAIFVFVSIVNTRQISPLKIFPYSFLTGRALLHIILTKPTISILSFSQFLSLKKTKNFPKLSNPKYFPPRVS